MNTPNTIKIIRYSTTGFKPQKQTHHLKDVNYHMYDFNINDYPEYARYNISQIHEKTLAFYKEHLTDLKEGIWFFINGHKNNQSLNHLTRKVPCWEAEIESDAYVYDVNWKYITDLSDPFVKLAGCYLPKSQMSKIHNIKKKKRIPYKQ